MKLDEKYGFNGYESATKGEVITNTQVFLINNNKLYLNYSFIPIGDLNEGVILLLNDFTDIKKISGYGKL